MNPTSKRGGGRILVKLTLKVFREVDLSSGILGTVLRRFGHCFSEVPPAAEPVSVSLAISSRFEAPGTIDKVSVHISP
jgi:hypothetical protein